MHTLTESVNNASVALMEGYIAVLLDDESFLLSNGARARRAMSCLVEPQAGDRVLISRQGEGDCHVLHILARGDRRSAYLSVPGTPSVALRQQRLALYASDTLELASAGTATLSADGGTLSLNGKNLFVTVSESIIEQASHYVGKIGQYLLDVSALLRLHGNDALVTATRDVKVDAERISMG